MNFSHCFLLACDLEREQKTTFSGIGHWGVGHPVLLNVAEPRDRLVLPSVCIRACFTHSVWFHAAPPLPPLVTTQSPAHSLRSHTLPARCSLSHALVLIGQLVSHRRSPGPCRLCLPHRLRPTGCVPRARLHTPGNRPVAISLGARSRVCLLNSVNCYHPGFWRCALSWPGFHCTAVSQSAHPPATNCFIIRVARSPEPPKPA